MICGIRASLQYDRSFQAGSSHLEISDDFMKLYEAILMELINRVDVIEYRGIHTELNGL